ncbi:uncharacterized protein A4U43_C01F5650 [Asparagus officinalis]|uniref:Prolyl endopeptidase n=1 Tax=Asparagus officinalis TaxID=4686 RepID=A0A5P1FMA7_ASPOF|nr:uncharacterized protein A4U43_C01F5650 [Asparagus officinalis]
MDATDIEGGLWPVRKRVPGVQYFLEHHHGFFYILNNSPLEKMGVASGGYYLARCRAEKSLLSSWQAIIVPRGDITFHDMDMFRGNLVLSIDKKGLPSFCSIDMPIVDNCERPAKVEELDPWFFPVPSNVCNITPGSNQDFMSSIYRVVISSPVMPDVIVDYNMAKRKFTILHQEEVVGLANDTEANLCAKDLRSNFSAVQFHDDKHLRSLEDSQKLHDISEAISCERKEVISHDGVKVPLTILYSKNAHVTSQSPGILHGYGAYGEVLDKSWGGGNLLWHQAGTGLHKLNSMYDFAACGLYLIGEGYVHKDRLSAVGTSAGGLLVGACMNMYPDLFCAAILKVPFLDICNTMLDSKLPLTKLDYEEFGDPQFQTQFETIQNYSPYDNILLGQCYPSVLVTASFYDSRVGVWEAAKWVAKVREITCPTCSRSIILKTNMSGGHFGEGGRYMHCEETAFEYAFLIKVMGRLHSEMDQRDGSSPWK